MTHISSISDSRYGSTQISFSTCRPLFFHSLHCLNPWLIFSQRRRWPLRGQNYCGWLWFLSLFSFFIWDSFTVFLTSLVWDHVSKTPQLQIWNYAFVIAKEYHAECIILFYWRFNIHKLRHKNHWIKWHLSLVACIWYPFAVLLWILPQVQQTKVLAWVIHHIQHNALELEMRRKTNLHLNIKCGLLYFL